MKTKAVQVTFKGETLNLPAGLRVKPVGEFREKPCALCGGPKREYVITEPNVYWLDQFPYELFPSNSILLWDATHIGIRLTADQIEE